MSEHSEQEQLSIPGAPGEADLVGGQTDYQKPVFEAMTPAKITGVTWHKETTRKKDKQGVEYLPCYFEVDFEVEGYKDAVKEFYSFSIYENIINGKTSLNAFYGTDKSKCGALRRLVEKTFNLPAASTLAKFMETLAGKEVIIKSEETSYQGKPHKKIVIQQFRI